MTTSSMLYVLLLASTAVTMCAAASLAELRSPPLLPFEPVDDKIPRSCLPHANFWLSCCRLHGLLPLYICCISTASATNSGWNTTTMSAVVWMYCKLLQHVDKQICLQLVCNFAELLLQRLMPFEPAKSIRRLLMVPLDPAKPNSNMLMSPVYKALIRYCRLCGLSPCALTAALLSLALLLCCQCNSQIVFARQMYKNLRSNAYSHCCWWTGTVTPETV